MKQAKATSKCEFASREFKVMNVILKYRKFNLNSPSVESIDAFSRTQRMSKSSLPYINLRSTRLNANIYSKKAFPFMFIISVLFELSI